MTRVVQAVEGRLVLEQVQKLRCAAYSKMSSSWKLIGLLPFASHKHSHQGAAEQCQVLQSACLFSSPPP